MIDLGLLGIPRAQLTGDEACAVISGAIDKVSSKLTGYDCIVIVRRKGDGMVSLTSSLENREQVQSAMRGVMDHLAIRGL